MSTKIQKLSELFRRRHELEDEMKMINEDINNLIGGDRVVIKTAPKKTTKKQVKKWSRKHDQCVDCGTTDHPHKSKGLCIKCYSPKKIKEMKPQQNTKKQNGDLPPISSSANKYKCEECGHEFSSVLDYMDVRCENCGSTRALKLP